ncbi:hypothetical protein [Haliangium ochraceum]|uniref:STAS domain-containing protein n=1 Tax=Haliangium ochraceum (strain DSM 14365 / JCM 11303 / SMP-2) TaxID=502025 RepID=D0LQ31_HALO1|nr:hypothetical protein [Haliangium ochraceum]ACY17068.1 hypothetical protein Hoch_4577 [Haliangium ochraceum DSM 14365]
MAGPYEFEIQEAYSVYTLTGEFDTRAAHALRRSAQSELVACERLVIDLRKLRNVHQEARVMLADIHRIWAEKAERVAYLATDARLRGLSLWVVRTAGDRRAKALGSPSQMETWLRSSGASAPRASAPSGNVAWPKGNSSSSGVHPAGPTAITAVVAGSGEHSAATAATTVQAAPSSRAAAPVNGYARATPTGSSDDPSSARWVAQLILGLRPPWFGELIRTHGFAEFERWSDSIQQAIEVATQHHGEIDAQLLLAFTSLWSGCTYCARGHLLAANLIYYETKQSLFPLAEAEVLAWRRLDKERLLSMLGHRITDTELEPMRTLLFQASRIERGRETDPGDEPVVHALTQAATAWTMVGACRNSDATPGVPPLHPRLARDRQLLDSYRRARLRQEASPRRL